MKSTKKTQRKSTASVSISVSANESLEELKKKGGYKSKAVLLNRLIIWFTKQPTNLRAIILELINEREDMAKLLDGLKADCLETRDADYPIAVHLKKEHSWNTQETLENTGYWIAD